MNALNPELSDLGNLVKSSFELILQTRFAGDPAANMNVDIEVFEVGEIETPTGTQNAFVVVAPWTMNGLLVPGDGLPPQVLITEKARAVFNVELPGVGAVAQVNIVPDVSKYTAHSQAHTIAESFVPVWRDVLTQVFAPKA